VTDLSLPARPGRSALYGVSFDVRAGDVVGLYGLMGAGRTELLESIMGVHADARGGVEIEGRRLGSADVSARIAAGVTMVPEDRQAAGLVPTLSVEDNLTLSSLPVLARWGYLSPAVERQSASRLAAELRIKAASLGAPITSLSGGNQQKVIIGRGLMRRPRVLLFDEPTRGVDVAAKAEILDAMRRLAADQLGVVFASSDLDEMRSTATRVLVMARGRVTAEFDAAQATDAALASAASAGVSRGADAVA
jgi:erythritol transport system ATP-binding protein